MWKRFNSSFEWLPITALIADRIFCLHGGLSPDGDALDVITTAERPVETKGAVLDLLWSDPDKDITGWGENDRGMGHTFGPDVVAAFLKRHDLDLICRGHQVIEDGYEFFGNRSLVTIFSAPNYCGEFDNAGAALNVSKDLLCSFDILKVGVDLPRTCNTNTAQHRPCPCPLCHWCAHNSCPFSHDPAVPCCVLTAEPARRNGNSRGFRAQDGFRAKGEEGESEVRQGQG